MSAISSIHMTKIEKALLWTKKILWIERFWPSVLKLFTLWMIYISLGLCGIIQTFPDILHLIGLIVLVIFSGFYIYCKLRSVSPPSIKDVIQRIEQTNHLLHHPLQTLQDYPANRASISTWEICLQRIYEHLPSLKTGWPRLLTRQGTLGWVGYSIMGLVVILVVINGDNTPSRLLSSFRPGFDDSTIPLPKIQAWITPAAYSGEAPLFLQSRKETITIAANSRIHIVITDLASRPYLLPKKIISSPDIKRLSQNSWQIQGNITTNGKLQIRSRGRDLATWNLNVPDNTPPKLLWTGIVGGKAGDWHSFFPFEATQHYGIASIQLKIALISSKIPNQSLITLPIPIDEHPKEIKYNFYSDLSDSLWVDQPVNAILKAEDVSGQIATSTPAFFKLPHRHFSIPMANAVQTIRLRLGRGQQSRTISARNLVTLASTTPNAFSDYGLFLNLASVIALLNNTSVSDLDAISEAVDRLWQLALNLEESKNNNSAITKAAVELRTAQQSVAEQLDRMRQLGKEKITETDKIELTHRLDRLQQAINQKISMLFRQALLDQATLPNNETIKNLENNTLTNLFKTIEDSASNEQDAKAAQQLQQINDLLDRMRNASAADIREITQQLRLHHQLQHLMQELENIGKEQVTLLDHSQTYQTNNDTNLNTASAEDLSKLSTPELLRRLGITSTPALSDQSNETQKPSETQLSDPKQDKKTQLALSQTLSQLESELKQLTKRNYDNLNKANDNMKAAYQALDAARYKHAVFFQQEALMNLQQGNQDLRRSLQNTTHNISAILPNAVPEEGEGLSDSSSQENSTSGIKDPLGRELGGKSLEDLSVEPSKAYEIEEELRRRASDLHRPKQELDYLNRLLKLF